MDDIRSEVYRIIAGQFSVEENGFSDKTGPGDLPAWNSLGHLQLVMALEKRFQIRFTADDVMSFEDVGDLVALVERAVRNALGGTP
jgi:acyl carrier protein